MTASPRQDNSTPISDDGRLDSLIADPEQLGLRLFARIDSFDKVPPERAFMRELLDVAIGSTKLFTVGKRTISANLVWAVGVALYLRSNAAGIIENFSIARLATDCRIGVRAVEDAIKLLRKWATLTITRPRPKGKRGRGSYPAIYRINPGGLTLAAMRRRAIRDRHARLPLEGHIDESTDGPSRHQDGLVDGPSRHQDRFVDDHPVTRTGHKGYVPEGLSIRAADARTTPPRKDEEEQQQLGLRAEGLFASTAILARKLNRDYDELDERNRFAHGEITIDDLQILRNKLAAELEQKRSRVRL